MQGTAIEQVGTIINEDRSLSLTQRQSIVDALRATPFLASKPHIKLNPDKLRPSIELAMLMNTVLDRDYLVRHGPLGSRIPAQRVRGGINSMPSDPEYPKSQSASAMAFYNTVEVDRPANNVQDHIDRAHKTVFNQPFYTQGRMLGMRWPGGKADELVRAENVLKKLSRPAIPRSIADVRFA